MRCHDRPTPPRGPFTALLVPLAIAALGVGACGSAPTERYDEGSPGTDALAEGDDHLVLGIQQEPDVLNSALNSMVYGTYINQCIYGYFVKYDANMELIPDVLVEVPTLENGGIGEDGLTYTYRLRDDVTWHDGEPFTAEDVVFSVDAYLDPRHEVETRSGFDKIESMETPDPHTVVFRLKEVYVKFVEDTFFDEPLLPAHVLADEVGVGFSDVGFHRAPIGCGPFRFEEWVSGSHVRLRAYPDYFRGEPGLDAITFRFITDTNSLLLALRAGEIDGYDNAATDQYERLQSMDDIVVHVTPSIQWEHVDLNMEHPILSDRRVRQAIQRGIDRNVISEEIYGGLWKPAYGDVFPELEWAWPGVEEIARHDPDEARRLLDEAGWKPGKDGIRFKDGEPLRLAITTTSGRQQRELTEQVLQQQLRGIGIDLRIENHNATTLFAPYADGGRLKRGEFDMAMYAWVSSPDPDRWTLYHSSQVPPPEGQNMPRFRNERLDHLLEVGLRTIDAEKRREIYNEVQEIVATEVPMVALVWRADLDPMTARLKGYAGNPTQTGDTWNAWQWRLE